MGNPRFVMQLLVELALGLSAKTAAEMKARGDKCFKVSIPVALTKDEKPLFCSAGGTAVFPLRFGPRGDRRLCSCLASLSETIIQAAAIQPHRQRHRTASWAFFAGRPPQTLQMCGRCAAQGGAYSVSQRLTSVLYRSCQFFVVGLVTSAMGHSITKWAVGIEDPSAGHAPTCRALPRWSVSPDRRTTFTWRPSWTTAWASGRSWRSPAISATRWSTDSRSAFWMPSCRLPRSTPSPLSFCDSPTATAAACSGSSSPRLLVFSDLHRRRRSRTLAITCSLVALLHHRIDRLTVY